MFPGHRLRPTFRLCLIVLGSLLAATVAAAAAFDPPNPAVSGEPEAFRSTTLISFDQGWRLWDRDEAPPAGWHQPGFDDRKWTATQSAVAHVRREADLDRLRLARPAHPLRPGGTTAYIRTTFEMPVAHDQADTQLVLDLFIKDGGVIYLNGTEVGRTPSMPEGAVDHATQAERATRLRVKSGFHIDPAHLRPGPNVLAISLHSYRDPENRDIRAGAVELTLVSGWHSRPLTTRPEHVRVLWLEKPQQQAVISWTTGAAGSTHRLHVDTETRHANPTDYARSLPATRSGAFTLAKADIAFGTRPGHFHHVFLNDLQPDTTYYFVVASDGIASREYSFRTAPADDRPVRVIFGGDSRIGGQQPYFHQDRRAMNRRIAALAEEHDDVIAFIHGGDFAQTAQWRHLALWLYDHELVMTQDGRLIPMIPARGNHDLDIGFEEAFWWPGQEGRYTYQTDLTPRVRLITLNTEISHGGRQRQWLSGRLAELRPESRWLLVSYHRPAWPSVRAFTSGAPRRQFWVPLFDEFRVDLVMESHDHALKRTVPILNGAAHPDGVVYIGDGGLGVPQRDPDPSRWYLQEGGMTRATHHVHLLELGPDTLRGRAFDPGGELVDDFTLNRRSGRAWGGGGD